MAKTNPINIANPPGGSSPKLGDDYIRTLAMAVAEVLGIDHIMELDGNAYDSDDSGKHAQVTIAEVQGVKPVLTANDKAVVYVKGATPETYIEDASANEIQVTGGGKLKLSAGQLDNDSTLKALNAAGNAQIDLIKANATDGVEIPAALKVGGKITNLTAPDDDTDAANKAYVDAAIPAFGDWSAASSVSDALTEEETNDLAPVQAETDLLLVASISATTTDARGSIFGYTDENIDPATKRCVASVYQFGTSYGGGSFIMPVKKDHYYKVTSRYGAAANATGTVRTFFTIPLS